MEKIFFKQKTHVGCLVSSLKDLLYLEMIWELDRALMNHIAAGMVCDVRSAKRLIDIEAMKMIMTTEVIVKLHFSSEST